jgi:D-alanyl-D-alanine carboxypeptidase (penicillin-binding protein 5/6)
MKKRVLLSVLAFLFVVFGAQSEPVFCSSSTGSHVYRASIGPRPKAEPVAPPAAQACPQPIPRTEPADRKASPKTVTPGKTPGRVAPHAPGEGYALQPKGAKSLRQLAPPATAQDILLNVQAAVLINMSTGQVYYEHNPDKAIQPASITKLLTLYLLREELEQGRLTLSTPIPVSSKAVRTGGSRMRLKRGEKVPLGELIKGISVASANNACVAVAEYLGDGDPDRFVSRMNEKARKIGMTSSTFKNPNGLPDRSQLSTARDIAKLSMKYLREFPESLKVHSMKSHTYHGATHRNANSLLRNYKGADGLKTGFVCEAGYNITATAKRGETRLLAVVLGAQSSSVRRKETRRLLDYGFRRAQRESALADTSVPSGKPKG